MLTSDRTMSVLTDVLPASRAVACLVLITGVCTVLALGIRRIIDWIVQLRTKRAFLEVRPSAATDKLPVATNQLFKVVHGANAARPWYRRLFTRVTVSLEIVSSKTEGIRFYIGAPVSQMDMIRHHLIAYVPESRTELVRAPGLNLKGSHVRAVEFRQSGHFALPLARNDALDDTDPAGYLTGAMTGLGDGELLAVQLIASPVKSKAAAAIARRLLRNEDVVAGLTSGKGAPVRGSSALAKLIASILSLPADIIWGHTMQNTGSERQLTGHLLMAQNHLKPERTLSAKEEQLTRAIHYKVTQSVFRTDLRAIAVSQNRAGTRRRLNGIKAVLASYGDSSYQSLAARPKLTGSLGGRYLMSKVTRRLPSFRPGRANLFAASELAGLFHFPNSTSAKTENVMKSLSRTLPAPVSLKQSIPNAGITVGRNIYHGAETDIVLTRRDRERHCYIIGGTGNGKTTLLESCMIQDANLGNGFAFIDPHGDAAQNLLRHIPSARIEEVVYLNPDDLSYPIGLNLLELREGLAGDELLREKDLITEATVSVFRKIFSDQDEGGHRIEYVLRNTIQTALTQDGATLFTVFDLLNDPVYRKRVVSTLGDKDLKNFWQQELGKAGNFQRVKMAAGITAKIGRFLFSASAKRMLEQPRSTINFDDIINSGKILICNVSKGLLGEDTAELFGITILAKLQLAALRRARMARGNRRPFYLYVDEFQNFATTSFVQMLSEARKYEVLMTLAQQSTAQQPDQRLINVVLANVGTLIAFRTASPADERLLLPFFAPFIESGEIGNLPSFNFYMRMTGVTAQEPFSGKTVLPASDGSDITAAAIIEYSRAHYAKRFEPPAAPTAKNAATAANSLDKKPGFTRPKSHLESGTS